MSFNYQRYLASREWACLKKQVRGRSGGWCERCIEREAKQVHHLTYERIGRERLEDLQHLCKPCHEYLSAVIDDDPRTLDLTPAEYEWLKARAADDDPHFIKVCLRCGHVEAECLCVAWRLQRLAYDLKEFDDYIHECIMSERPPDPMTAQRIEHLYAACRSRMNGTYPL